MTLRFVDSFDHYATADIAKKWTSLTTGAQDTVTISAGNGRFATQSFRIVCGNGGNPTYLTKGLTSQATWVVGLAFKQSYNIGNLPLIVWYDGATQHATLQVNSDGTISITKAGTILGTSTRRVFGGVWYFIEFKVTIDDAAGAGTCQVRVNNDLWLTNVGAWDTRNGGNASADTLIIGKFYTANINTWTMDVDDIYVEDGVDATATQGAPYNDFLGEHRIKALTAAADANYTGSWTRVGAGVDADYKAVDEALQDGDTTYLASITVDHRSSYTFSSPGASGTVKAIAMNVMAEKDDVGVKLLDVFARRTATDYDRSDDFNLLSSYYNFQDIWGVHPDTTPWTLAIAAALEAGIRMEPNGWSESNSGNS